MKKAFLVLETGEVYSGKWHGGEDRAGEVVFNTSHSGYEEIATDPSYFSQIVVMTAPMQGNYGAHKEVWESKRLWIEGFISLQIQDTGRDQAWVQRLNENKIPLMTEVDTRELVLRLRSGGTPWGALVQAASEAEAKQKAAGLIAEKKKLEKDWVYLTSRKDKEVRRGDFLGGPKVAVLDFGSKENILRELQKYCSEMVIYPSRTPTKELLSSNPDFVMLTNGPGDPADVQVAPQTIRELIGQKPVFGICMGHQVLSLALGAKTYKLKFGHRGSNHPIKDDLLGQIYVTSQNHGYAVDPQTLPVEARVTQINLNDGTVAGFYNPEKKYLGIQYHPEACPGPHEAQNLFKFFIEKVL
ncbi:glutamine-hydrolyzing carbamoyl-phosphate synthase small subunit [Bdellovibrio sp. HCB337]|uniref:glutamine-hydrolyzing carbamoyl-phosphate synthase small subunit n=1 Tax=Bdellovibrio sp. HCB337 TaxID=3394358 RepID=UPI0039A70596